MTRLGRIIGFTALWAAYGGLVYGLLKFYKPDQAAAILAVIGSALYFLLLAILFFGGKR